MRAAKLIEEYVKHTALNLGQALHGMRHWTSHPDIDARAARGTARHLALSVALRSKRIANDLFFAAIPPHWHHTREELAQIAAVSTRRWFRYGYCAWRFDDTGAPRADLTGVDTRWDPRCEPTRAVSADRSR